MIISDSLDTVSVNRAAELLEVSRSGFYKWFQRSIRPDSGPNLEIQIREEIQNIVIEFPGYGYRRVTIELQNRDYSVKEKIMRHRLRPPFLPESLSIDMRIKCLALINIHYSLKSSLNSIVSKYKS